MSLIGSIRRDIKAIYDNDPAAVSTIEIILAYPGFHARELHRIAHRLYLWRVPVLPRLVSHCNRCLTGIEIHPGAKIGEGFFVDHGMGVVIGETAEVGDNCVLYQGVTLGGTSMQRIKRHPTLGNNVEVGAHAQIIGAITIGDNTKVGSGSVVVNSAPANATVVGVPGRVVAIRNPDTNTTQSPASPPSTKCPDPVWDRIDKLEKRIIELESGLSGASRITASFAGDPAGGASRSTAAGAAQPTAEGEPPCSGKAGQKARNNGEAGRLTVIKEGTRN
jgi:serine O-acetyltransferase